MNESFLKTVSVWKNISFTKEIAPIDFKEFLHNSQAQFLSVGDFYCYLFNLKAVQFDYISDSIESVLGYDKDEITVPFFISLIHPDDVPYFIEFENQVVQFFNNLSTEQLSNYKVRYDYRVKTKSGNYVRILHQMMALITDEENKISQTFCYHTDITYLKPEGTPLLSFIGMNGEPSYVNVTANTKLNKPYSLNLSKREIEIVKYLVQGSTSKDIAGKLHLSVHTVRTHRKNILRKLYLNNTIDLTTKAIQEGWL